MLHYYHSRRALTFCRPPFLIYQVVDHASRVPTSSRKRILGILLGQNDGKTINVANSSVSFARSCFDSSLARPKQIRQLILFMPSILYHSFAVPFEEDDRDPKTWFLDLDYIESMWEMFRKVNGMFITLQFLHSPRLHRIREP
jgi:26S proteasome regulatory subunit N8